VRRMIARYRLTPIASICALVVSAAQSGSTQAVEHSQKALPTAHRADAAAPLSIQKIRAALESTRSSLDGAAELAPFFERLHRLSSEASAEPAHILHFGDSHTAGDEWTAALRNLFQKRFGRGGAGFSLAGQPFAGYRRVDASGGSTPGWKAAGRGSGAGDGYFGLGGVSMAAEQAGQSVYLNTECDLIEIQYLQQPRGGNAALYDAGQLLWEFSTSGDLQPEFRTFGVPPGAHRFRLTTTSAKPVRLFGWVTDKRQGITYESLGLNGARASVMLHWNEEMFATYLRRRDPALIVLAYGTNEAGDHVDAERYEEMFSKLLSRLRRSSPEAAIVVVGPPDVTLRSLGRVRSATEVDRIARAQQNSAQSNGCAFWDMREHMGGAGSMSEWARAGLAQPDLLHFTAAGYHALAEALFSDLMGYYATYERIRSEVIEETSQD
jgi:lysophospholipase L1-like esterase